MKMTNDKTNLMSENNATILLPYSVEEFSEMIRTVLRTELQKYTNKMSVEYSTPGLTQKPLYKAAEVCVMLNISRVTLDAWVKDGLLRKYKIKSRVFYLYSEIEKLLGSQEAG